MKMHNKLLKYVFLLISCSDVQEPNFVSERLQDKNNAYPACNF